jgi:hypothetical protein
MEKNRILDKYRSNGFPEPVIRKAFQKWKPIQAPRGETQDSEKPQFVDWVKLPYLPGMYELCARWLGGKGIRVVSAPLCTLKTTLAGRDQREEGGNPGPSKHPLGPLNGHLTSTRGAVYQIPCADCSSVYIGESGRPLARRACEHVRDVKNKAIGNGIAQHCAKNNHEPDFSQTRILFRESNYQVRIQLEALAIAKAGERAMNLAPANGIMCNWKRFLASHLGLSRLDM